jgi:hypothetical protein
MEVIQAGDKVLNFADRHGSNVKQMLAMPDFGSRITDAPALNYEVSMMTAMWQLASGLMKDLTEPLKSIVNK